MARDRAPTEDELKAMVRHIAFDIKMLRGTSQRIAATSREEQERLRAEFTWIAVAEACMLHERNLLNFFYPPVDLDQWQQGDVFADDYFGDRSEDWSQARGTRSAAKKRLGKDVGYLYGLLSRRLAHLHLDRLVTSDWRELIVADALLDIVNTFVSNLPQPFESLFRLELDQPL